MQVGWPGLSRAIALTIALTSAFWVALGAWLFNGHVSNDHGGARLATRDGQGSRSGLLSGFSGAAMSHGTPPRAGVKRLGPAAPLGSLVIPVQGVAPGQLSDTFTQAREDGARAHDAIDILAPEGTAIVAAADGRVEKLFLSDDGGNTVYVRSPDRRRIFYYAHLAAYAPDLREGQAVRRGQVLGAVGHTGNADPAAPHLHFAVWNANPAQGWSQDGVPINPYPILAGRSARR